MSLKTIFSDSSVVYNPVSAEQWNVLNGSDVSYSALLTFGFPDDPTHADDTQIPILITKIGANNFIISIQLSQLTYDGCAVSVGSNYPYKSTTPLPAGFFNPDKDIQIGVSSGVVFGNSNDVIRPCPYSWYIDTDGYIYYTQAYSSGYAATDAWSVGWNNQNYHYHPSCSTTGKCNIKTAIADGTILYTNSTFLVSLL